MLSLFLPSHWGCSPFVVASKLGLDFCGRALTHWTRLCHARAPFLRFGLVPLGVVNLAVDYVTLVWYVEAGIPVQHLGPSLSPGAGYLSRPNTPPLVYQQKKP